MFEVGGGLWSWYAVVRDDSSGLLSSQHHHRWNDANDAAKIGILREAFRGFCSPVPDILDATADLNIFYSPLSDRRPLLGRKWGKGAVTLMGDAAHTVLPVMGQGGCLAV